MGGRFVSVMVKCKAEDYPIKASEDFFLCLLSAFLVRAIKRIGRSEHLKRIEFMWRSHRLSVRTLGFHPSKRSSTLLGITTCAV